MGERGAKGSVKGQRGASRAGTRVSRKGQAELQKICNTILELLDGSLIASTGSGESKVFYQKMKADYYRYIAEFSTDDAKTKAAESATKAYAEAAKVAEKDLAVTHPIRLGLALNFFIRTHGAWAHNMYNSWHTALVAEPQNMHTLCPSRHHFRRWPTRNGDHGHSWATTTP